MQILAPAKINLFLEVNRRRADGYHAIESIMQTVSLYDTVTLTPQPSRITLECDLPSLPVDDRNLAFKAACLLKEALTVDQGAHIRLSKKIPLGAGLGGGSSDAAAVLKGLAKMWKLKVTRTELVALGTRLGADVPFFLEGGAALASGIGEKLKPLKGARPFHCVLVYPGFPVATKWVYENLRFPLTSKQKITKIKAQILSGIPPEGWGQYLFNRLEEVVLPNYPEIRLLKDTLARLGCYSLMSGSGSTVFGVVPTSDEGERVRSKLTGAFKDVWLAESVQ